MSILKVGIGRNAGIHATPAAIEESTGKFGPQYKVSLGNGDDFYVNTGPLEQQVQYHKLDSVQDLIGKEAYFWRKPMADDPSKAFFNIEFGSGPSNGVANAAHEDDFVGRSLRNHGAMPALPAMSFDDIKDKYVASLGAAVAIADDFTAFTDGVALPPEQIVSIAATLFIERNKRGA